MPEDRRFEQLSPKAYEHPTDRAATAALRSIPLMDRVVKRLTDLAHERRLRQVLVGNAVRISDRQVPALWSSYTAAASALDLEGVPALYVTQTPLANAMTVGAHTPLVIVASGLAAGYEPDEVHAVLAHELGHVLSEHYYYTTAYLLLAQFLRASSTGPLAGVPVMAIYLVLLEWVRASELSADRASALVVGDPLVTCRMLMRMAGGAIEGMDLDAFLAQATEYEEEEDLFARWSRAGVELMLTHPFAVRRVKELIAWVSSGDFERIRDGNYVRRGQEPPPGEEFQAAVAHYRERFTQLLGRATGGVQRVVNQIEDWLRGTDRDPHDDGGGGA